MGKVNEYEGLGLVDANETIPLMGCKVNECMELSVSAAAVTYGVYINEDLIYSCSVLKNAETIYDVIRADMAGKTYEGTG